MKKILRKIGALALAISVMSACQKDNNPPPAIVLGDTVQSMNLIGENAYVMVNGSAKIEVFSTESFANGYFITNEGNFGSANGSISFVDQYNNSEEIDITYMHVNTIDVVSPRYMAKVSDVKAYVTDWGINGVQVIDLLTNTVSSTIACGAGPEGIAVSNGFAYVCNVGGWGLDNTVTVINTEVDAVETTLGVGDKPNSVVVDANGAVWVLSGGFTEYGPAPDYAILSQTSGSLVKVVNNIIELSIYFPVGNSPKSLVINDAGTTLYYSDGSWAKAVYAFNVNDTELPTTALINRSFYSLGFNDGYIYGTDAVDYVQSGWSYKYATNGSIIDSVQVGIIPGGYCFN